MAAPDENADGATGGGNCERTAGCGLPSRLMPERVEAKDDAYESDGLRHSRKGASSAPRGVAAVGRRRLAMGRRGPLAAARAAALAARAARAARMPSALHRETPSLPERHWEVSVVPQAAQRRGVEDSGAGAEWTRETKRPREPRWRERLLGEGDETGVLMPGVGRGWKCGWGWVDAIELERVEFESGSAAGVRVEASEVSSRAKRNSDGEAGG